MIKSGTHQVFSFIDVRAPTRVEFGLLDPEEILRKSVCNIQNERIYDGVSFQPSIQGVNDPRMGTMDREVKCYSCKGMQVDCPGHFGHIDLARPVYHVGLLEYVRKILRCVCYNCSKLLAPRNKEKLEQLKKIKRNKTRFNQILKICETQVFKQCSTSSEGCGFRQPKFQKKGMGIIVEYYIDFRPQDKAQDKAREKFFEKKRNLMPEEVYKILSKVSSEDQEILGIKNPQNMIIKRLAVAPPPVRPSIAVGSTMRSEDDLTYSYQAILKQNNLLKNHIEKGANQSAINEIRNCLQYFIATLMDNEISGQPVHKHKSGKPLKAIRARLKGKEGRLRGNLMGKRVDFSARSVITPDPNLLLDQLGVPQRIAMNVTVPETVSLHNLDELRKLVFTGPNEWPGAKYIIRHDKRQIDLGMLPNRSDAHLEPGYIVERHLRDGDIVLFNRQPSLHKMSIMGHRVKVLPQYTFRLNLSVTTPYNADFDGDEMNMFVPQGYESIAEIKEIMAVHNQIVSPQSNKPVMGIVQDSLLGIMIFTKKDTFVDLETVLNLMMWIGQEKEFSLPEPTIIKPKQLWTGKQIISAILPKVNLIKSLDGQIKTWLSHKDSIIIIKHGQLLAGNLTKQTVGSASGGLIHIIWKEFGPQATNDFLSQAQNVINNWLCQHGFTVGVQDVISSQTSRQLIKQTLEVFEHKVDKVIQRAQCGKLKFQPGKNMMESFEAKINKRLNNARDQAGHLVFQDLEPTNKIQNMVHAGSKGTNINISQILGCVGQQNVEGNRIPFGFNQRTLPHFTKSDYGANSKGFVKSNYLLGLSPSEFFFHAMGGREGLIDTAVKTSETGYIQRRLMKALEDVMVKYDSTVRNSSDQIVQFLYGEDGMAGEHIEDLKIDILRKSDKEIEDEFCFFPINKEISEIEDSLRQSLDENILKQLLDQPNILLELNKEYQKIKEDRDLLRKEVLLNLDDSIHLPINLNRLIFNAKEQFSIHPFKKCVLRPEVALKRVQEFIRELTVFPKIKYAKVYDEANINSTLLTKIYLRSELCCKKLISKHRFSLEALDWLLGEIKSRFESGLVHPGEMVGSIAAHSIGEPATQMTLNTFHFAGVSSKNVTLGVPRLKEVINVAKNIKTPMVQIYMEDSYKKSEIAILELQGMIEHATLGHVIDDCGIYYDPDPVKTLIKDDKELVSLFWEIPDEEKPESIRSPWLMRFVLNPDKLVSKQLTAQFIANKLEQFFQEAIHVMHTDDNADIQIIRVRFRELQEEYDENSRKDVENLVQFLKDLQDNLLNDVCFKGFPEITKVYAKRYQEQTINPVTKAFQITDDNWMLETDGVALQKILAVPNVNYKRTISNDLLEILKVLGVEAARKSLINELRQVLNFYGIYVNYRHLATLCDVMTQRGRLTSITRHGINRLDSGPLRKCSFEETVEILLEAAIFNDVDKLKGITENIIMGKLAPFGTGFFDLMLNDEFLEKNVQVSPDDEFCEGENTPMLELLEGIMPYQTQYQERTPKAIMGGQTSEYQQTPGQGGQSFYAGMSFSPAPNVVMSPGCQSSYYQSPAYTNSPLYGYRQQSPLYKPEYVSPIYFPQEEQQNSPLAISRHSSSPNYSPTNPSVGTPSVIGGLEQGQATYSPSYIGSRQGQSPLMTPNRDQSTPISPTYSPYQGNQNQNQIPSNYSPSVSGGPGPYIQHQSPSYSPTTPAYGTVNFVRSAQYSPQYSPNSPAYNSSPKYQLIHPVSSHSQRNSPLERDPERQEYVPTSPAYNPSLGSYGRLNIEIRSDDEEDSQKNSQNDLKKEEE